CAGHLFEAAVAHHAATGTRTLLDVAVRFADHIDWIFEPGRRTEPPGHPEIEIGLIALADATGDRRYLDLAAFLIDARGRTEGRESYGAYAQDHQPVAAQTEAVGHAVRAAYLFTGMADLAMRVDRPDDVAALDRLWTNVVGAKLYITGGIGASASGEAFGADYELPNESAYAETCGAIANVIWNDRMARLHRDVRAADIIERALYNGFLVGVSVPGDTFFYPNPLATDGVHPFNHGSPERSPWFDCACCPSNDVRAMEWIPGLIYARNERGGVHVNQYAPGVAAITVDGREVALTQETDYPWDGRIRIRVRAADGRPVAMALHLRLPGWARGEPVPGDLYRDLTPPDPAAIRCTVNEQAVPIRPQDRAVTIERPFAADDVITLDLPMPVRRVIAHDAVVADRGLVALERGPIVYCLEGVDHGGRARHIALPDDAPIEASMDAATGMVVITGHGLARHRDPTTLEVLTSDQPIRAIPYHAWNHRGATEMTVWMPRDVDDTLVPPTPTAASSGRASASHTWASDRAGAVNDQREPRRSSDETVPRFTWWDHRGTTEWLQLDFPAPTTVSRVAVYWFDDSGRGACR
ncbi:MAG: glycoside hydrolase family 127 protein, partial [Phycisphaerales bacterium]|nr:glycoside hydrolase family 127 protein [Phycisphaerales bacterium]